LPVRVRRGGDLGHERQGGAALPEGAGQVRAGEARQGRHRDGGVQLLLHAGVPGADLQRLHQSEAEAGLHDQARDQPRARAEHKDLPLRVPPRLHHLGHLLDPGLDRAHGPHRPYAPRDQHADRRALHPAHQHPPAGLRPRRAGAHVGGAAAGAGLRR
ncbi:hypothetical protein LTR53_018861, partial [Teratosphaeriaceae sp. CCFEE 6253]